jgi:predicted enzyme related to lactoylglutathione lyase
MPDMPTGDPEQFYQAAPLLLVPDVPTTADYYRKVLGFQSDADGTSPEYTVVWRDNASVHLAKGEQPPSGVRIFFWVKDVNALHEDVKKRGAEIEVPIETRPYKIRDFSIRDPNGVLLVFGQDWHRLGS